MALQFNPPDWLIQDYINRRRPIDETADILSRISQERLAQNRHQEIMGLKKQESRIEAAKIGYDPENPQAYWDQFNENHNLASRKTESDIGERTAHANYYNAKANETPQAERDTPYFDPATGKYRYTVPAGGKLVPPATTTQEAKTKTKEDAMSGVSRKIDEISKLYETLNSQGGIVNTENSPLSNVGARIASSKVGQFAGSAVGAQSQSTRNQIAMMRPLLMNDIRQASQMGARGLDSEKELEFYLKAATDPTLDIQANRHALTVLNNAYGLGAKSEMPASVPLVGGTFNGGKVLSVKRIK